MLKHLKNTRILIYSKTMKNRYFDILRGTLDAENPLSKLRANALIWTHIFKEIDEWYEKHIDRESIAYKKMPLMIIKRVENEWKNVKPKFPEPIGIFINMMPIHRDKDSIPEYLHSYLDFIMSIPTTYLNFNTTTNKHEKRVVYLTIHESFVPSGQYQRRSGLHIERPNNIGGRFVKPDREDKEYRDLAWGAGYTSKHGVPIDGIYMASNVADSCKVWPVLLREPHEITDGHGGIEHMRDYLGSL